FTVREIGFFDNAGDLIFVVAGASMNEGTTGAYDLLYDAYFNLSHVKDGLVIVNAPDDALWAFSLSALTGLARSHLETQKLRDKLTALHGPF
ncbi:transposase, partial [Leisingera sp. MMG025]|nr:transposase [Leisingera sp. MMG026]